MAEPASSAVPIAAVEVRRVHHHPADGTLVLEARPWCEVTIDGAPRGATPYTTRLPSGLHKVRVSNAAFGIDSSFVVQIGAQKVVRRSLSFPQ